MIIYNANYKIHFYTFHRLISMLLLVIKIFINPQKKVSGLCYEDLAAYFAGYSAFSIT